MTDQMGCSPNCRLIRRDSCQWARPHRTRANMHSSCVGNTFFWSGLTSTQSNGGPCRRLPVCRSRRATCLMHENSPRPGTNTHIQCPCTRTRRRSCSNAVHRRRRQHCVCCGKCVRSACRKDFSSSSAQSFCRIWRRRIISWCDIPPNSCVQVTLPMASRSISAP